MPYFYFFQRQILFYFLHTSSWDFVKSLVSWLLRCFNGQEKSANTTPILIQTAELRVSCWALRDPQSGWPSTLGASEKLPESRKQLQPVPVTILVGKVFTGAFFPQYFDLAFLRGVSLTVSYFIASNEALGEVLWIGGHTPAVVYRLL